MSTLVLSASVRVLLNVICVLSGDNKVNNGGEFFTDKPVSRLLQLFIITSKYKRGIYIVARINVRRFYLT